MTEVRNNLTRIKTAQEAVVKELEQPYTKQEMREASDLLHKLSENVKKEATVRDKLMQERETVERQIEDSNRVIAAYEAAIQELERTNG
jgi:hypothetical protein